MKFLNKGIVCQMSVGMKSVTDRLRDSGLLRTQGLIGGKWIDAYDGKTLEVWRKIIYFLLQCSS